MLHSSAKIDLDPSRKKIVSEKKRRSLERARALKRNIANPSENAADAMTTIPESHSESSSSEMNHD
jgi:hypothetical protein